MYEAAPDETRNEPPGAALEEHAIHFKQAQNTC